jgi:phosphate transport system protein
LFPDNKSEAGQGGSVTSRRPPALEAQEALWAEVLGLASTVTMALASSVRAVCERRADLAAEVRAGERDVNRREVGIERECLRVLALYGPVACDFRRVVTAFRVNRELERIGDLAEHIAKRAKKLATAPGEESAAERRSLEPLARRALVQVRDGLDALARRDVGLARVLIAGDREVDSECRGVLEDLKRAIRREPGRVTTWLHLTNTARNLERAADHASNIAKAVIYLEEGVIVRHAGSDPSAPSARQGVP